MKRFFLFLMLLIFVSSLEAQPRLRIRLQDHDVKMQEIVGNFRFGATADSSVITTTDTLYAGYVNRAFQIDTVVVYARDNTPTLGYQIIHSAGDSLFIGVSPTVTALGKTVHSSWGTGDNTLTEGPIEVVFTATTVKPAKVMVIILGHWL